MKLKKIIIAILGVLTFSSLCVSMKTANKTVMADNTKVEWIGTNNVYGGENESRIALPLKLNGNTVKSFTLGGIRLTDKDYTVVDDGIILESKITTLLGRGAYVAKLTTSDSSFFKFIVYVGVNEGEGIYLDFDLNVYTNDSTLFIPSSIKYAIEDESLCFDGQDGTLFGFDKTGRYGFYQFTLKPETRYQLDFDFHFYDDMTMDWISVIYFNTYQDMVATLQMDATVTLSNNSLAKTEYLVTDNKFGSKHIHLEFTTPDASQCNGIYFSSSGYVHMDMDNVVLIPYSGEPLKNSKPEIGKISASEIINDADLTEEVEYSNGLKLLGEIANYSDYVTEVGFEITLPSGGTKTLAVNSINDDGQFALTLADVENGVYNIRSYLKYNYYGEDFEEKSNTVIYRVGEDPTENEAEIYIIAGQSNARGSSPANRVTVEDADANNAVMFYPGSFGDTASRQNVNFLPVTHDNANFENAGSIGPEAGFSYAMNNANGGKKIYIIKLAQGGSELHDRWASPSSGNTVSAGMSPLYSWLMETLESSAKYFKDNGITPKVKGFLWMQGESDCQTTEMADAYERNLNIFFDDIIADFSRIWETDLSNMPIVFGGIQKTKNMPYAETVIAAQQKIAKERDNCYFFKTSDLPLHDNWHFTGNAAFEVGTRFAEQILAHYQMDGQYTVNSDEEYFSVRSSDWYSLKEKVSVEVDKTELGSLISLCNYSADAYTDLSYADYLTALTLANKAYSGDVDQESVDGAADALRSAMENLVTVFDKSVLSELVISAKAVKGGTSTQRVRLETAINEAESLIDGGKISYALGETVKNEILSALNDIESVDSPESSNNSGAKSGCGGNVAMPAVGTLLIGVAVALNKKKKD